MAVSYGMAADLPYILQRWLHVPEGLTVYVDTSVAGEPLGQGELAVEGLWWSQTLP